MSLLDGLKDSMKNPLAENNNDMEFVLESDFELALEKATDVKLSPEDIRAILNGDDDIDDEEDDLDNPGDDVDKDYTSELEACKEALEATITELGIDDAADILDEDDDLDDLELDPEGEDEILSEESLLAEIEGIGTSDSAMESININNINNINVIPLKSVGKVKFGMSRDKVRSLFGNYTEFVKNKFSKNNPTDNFGFCHVYYDTSGKCYLIEIFDGDVYIGGTKVFPTDISTIKSVIPDLEKSDVGYTSRSKSIGIETDGNTVTSIAFGIRGYFDKIYASESFGISSEEEELIAECESLIADMPEDDEPPADDSAMESPNPGADKNIQVKGIIESDDEDDEDESEEDEDSDKHKHHHEECDDDEECEKNHHKHDEDDEDESEDDDEKDSDDDDDEKNDKKEKEDDDDEDEEAEESTLESILDNLLGVPM